MKKLTRKILSLVSVLSLVLSGAVIGSPAALAAAPTGTLTGSVISVDIGELKTMTVVTVTDAAVAEITLANDLYIQIPAGVNANWDTSDATATFGGTEVANAGAITYPDAKTLKIDITGNFANSGTLTIADLSFVGHTAATGAAALTWSIDGGTTYGNGNANTNVTVADGTVDTLITVTNTPTSAVVATQTTHAIAFTVPATGVIPADGQIVITFPAGFTVATAAVTGVTGIDGNFTIGLASPIVTLTRNGDGANSVAGAKTLTLNLITNQAVANSTYTVTVRTNTAAGALLATANSEAFLINPAAIANLSCVASGSGGAVYLRWATPAGATGVYTAKYSLANITNDGTFNAATTFTQAPVWATGTVGVTQQQLVTALTPNNLYFFNLKVAGAGTSLSAVSNTVFCTAPTSYAGTPDTKAPTSTITAPTAGQGIKAGESYTITGTSVDTGGSSVKQVEISLDGGTTWYSIVAITSTTAGLDWNYVWSAPALGSYTIKTRATDWVGNVETPGDGVSVTVSTTVPAFTAEIGGVSAVTPAAPTITTPSVGAALPYANPVTAAEISANIDALQIQLVSLLQQLIVILQAQLQALSL